MREMKDSGIEWIRDIPIKWDIIKFKYYFSIIGGNGFKEKFQGEETGDYPFCKASDINGISKKINKAKNYVSEEIAKQENYSIIPKNSILISKIGESLKKNHRKINSVPCIVDNNCEAFTLKRKDDIDYLYYLMTVINMMWFDNGGTIPSVNNEKLRNFYLPNPSVNEQQRLSTYLDDKCAKIDTIIEKQQEIIEKLKAYKLSLITETVTKGLNPDVKIKDSGYEFIGTVPEHWNVCRLRNIGTPQNGISKGGDFFGHGYPFVSYGDVYRNFLLPETVNGLVETTEEEREQYSVKEGDIFFTRTSETIEEVGFSCVCEKTIKNATFAGFVIRLRPFVDDLVTGFAKYYFRSNHHRFYLVKEMNLVTRASLGQNLLKSMPVLLPPKKEQQEIANYLDKKCSAIAEAIDKKQAIIEKLTEYKKSLIYEVVTGKKEVYNPQKTVMVFCPAGIPTNEEEYAKILLIQKIITRCGGDLKGRIHLMKILHALEVEIGFSFHSEYTRYTHGPYDKKIEKYESELVRKGWISLKKGKKVEYIVVNSTAYKTDYNRIFAKYNKEIERIIDFFKSMKRASKAEKVATLLASWNDFLIDGIAEPTDNMIITDVMTNWTENKGNIDYSTWQTILSQMKTANIVPHGYGRHTMRMED